MLDSCSGTVCQRPCRSRGQLVVERQRGTLEGRTAAGNQLHLGQNRSLGEGSQGRHSLCLLSTKRERKTC